MIASEHEGSVRLTKWFCWLVKAAFLVTFPFFVAWLRVQYRIPNLAILTIAMTLLFLSFFMAVSPVITRIKTWFWHELPLRWLDKGTWTTNCYENDLYIIPERKRLRRWLKMCEWLRRRDRSKHDRWSEYIRNLNFLIKSRPHCPNWRRWDCPPFYWERKPCVKPLSSSAHSVSLSV